MFNLEQNQVHLQSLPRRRNSKVDSGNKKQIYKTTDLGNIGGMGSLDPKVKMRTPQALAVSRAISCTPRVLDNGFQSLASYYLSMKYSISHLQFGIVMKMDSHFVQCKEN